MFGNVKDPVDKPEAMLTPGIVQLYSPFVYRSKDNLYMNPWQHLSQMGRKAKPIFAKPRAKVWETEPKRLKCNQHFVTATKLRKQTNAKYCQTQSTDKFIIKSKIIYNFLPLWWLLTSKDNNCDIQTGTEINCHAHSEKISYGMQTWKKLKSFHHNQVDEKHPKTTQLKSKHRGV